MSGGGPLRLPTDVEEAARDLLSRAQAAASDDYRGGVLRNLGALHALLVPLLDPQLLSLAARRGVGDDGPLSCGAGVLGLFRWLADLDPEREPIAELLLRCATASNDDEAERLAGAVAIFQPVGDAAEQEAQWRWLEAALAEAPLPQPRYLRRLARAAVGAFGDRARACVQRGEHLVLERLPEATAEPGPEPLSWHTDLGALREGDRLTLQIKVPVPGQLAVLHAAGDEAEAELTLLLPDSAAEEAPRRAGEVVEVTGEVAAVPGAATQALLVLWAPEEEAPSWVLRAVTRRRLPAGARLWRYGYVVTP